ncbi:hypothetical protein [Schleiferilactobacillus perolens]|uniref:Integron-associated effector binding protein domain-containing protein n=1 Tax=Schleiferilactobacillus perolens DSM 12744 TaxID=1423792 RepID=A0A0R1MMB2_9LACO|nr:hypothetical protein [Schleiferilactobacillus perolens]KRL08785.1 hypothetical protein FD09_GL001158 [Schleiferilactobacillus perolens DSM 12744]
MSIIQEHPLYMPYLMSTEKDGSPNQWIDGLNEIGSNPMAEGFYQVAPIIVKVREVTSSQFHFTYYMPVIAEPSDLSLSQSGLQYVDKIAVPHALMIRQANHTDDYTAAIRDLELYANENNYPLTGDFYMVVTEVYDTHIFDIFGELEAGRSE